MFNERLHFFINYKKKSIREFERFSGIKTGVISSAIRKNAAIGSDKLFKISVNYPDLNIKWLLTGEGEMLNAPGQVMGIDSGALAVMDAPVYYTHAKAVAGLNPYLSEIESYCNEVNMLPQYSLKLQIIVEIEGDSMEPGLKAKDKVLITPVLPDEVVHGKIYVIQTSDNGIYIKRVLLDRKGGNYILYSDNTQTYPDSMIVPAIEVVRIFRVLGTVNFLI